MVGKRGFTGGSRPFNQNLTVSASQITNPRECDVRRTDWV